MLTGLPDLFLCQWCQETWLSSELHQTQGEQVQERQQNKYSGWVGRVETLGTLLVSTPSFVSPCPESPMLT